MRNSDYVKQLKPSVKLDIKNKGIMVIKLVKYALFLLNVFYFPQIPIVIGSAEYAE